MISLDNEYCDKSKVINYDIKQYYEEVLNNLNYLIKKLNITNPIAVFHLYCYMYEKGLLSHCKKFVFTTDPNKLNDIDNLLGIDIITGRGCCRHLSLFFSDLLNNDKINNKLCLVHLRDKLIDLNKNPNHIINYIDINGDNYYLDPTSKKFYYKINSKLYFPDESYKYKYWIMKLTDASLISFKNLEKKDFFKEKDNNDYEILKFYKDTINNTKNIIKSNNFYIKKFYKDNNDNYEKIYKLSKKYQMAKN